MRSLSSLFIGSSLIVLGSCAPAPVAEPTPLSAPHTAVLFPPPSPGQLPSAQAPDSTSVASGQNEEDNQGEREAWIESMHRAAPGVDWRAIEAENGRAASERKQSSRMQRAVTTGEWSEVGSKNQAGNIVTSVRSADGNTLYLGSALGGVHKGPASGNDWEAISDHVYGGVSHLLALDSGSDRILVRASGGTVLRSTDEGATWTTPSGLAGISSAKRLLALQDASQTLLLLARNSGWRLYRSTDLGQTWSEARDLTGTVPDIWTSRVTLGPVYLLEENRMYKSTDGGQSFLTYGVPIAGLDASNAILGGHESAGDGVVFSIAIQPTNGGDWQLWRTEDSALTWSNPSNLPGMWSAFSTSTQSRKLIAYGGVNMYYSRDSGVSFEEVNGWAEYYGNPAGKLHADIMSLHVIPDATAVNDERWTINTHGGTYQSEDRLRTVENLSLSTLGVSQYYSTLTSRRDPNVVAGGTQDQGYHWGVTPANPGTSGPYADLSQLISGDYGHLSSSDGSHDLVYSDYPGFVLVQEGEVSPSLYTVSYPSGFAGQWLPFMTSDPTDKKSFYLLGQKIWRYTRAGGNSWAPVQHSTFDFAGTLSCIEFSPLDASRAWACTTDGRIFYSTDGAVNWTQSSDTGPGAHYFYGTTIVASERVADEVWIAGSGYSNAPVRYSSDGGVTWKNRSQNLPSTLAYCMCEAPDGSGRMYLGTQSGAWEWDPVDREWNDILGADGPITLYWSVETVPSRNVIRFGTYGRGIWDYSPGTPGFFPYGELRGEPNHLSLSASAQPLIGTTVELSVSGAPALANGRIVVCSASAEAPAYGGLLFVDLATQSLELNFVTDAQGIGQVSVSLPNNAALVGQERFLQAAVQDPNQVEDWALSHGLRAVIGE